jgi:hypothetical protein
MRRSGRIQFRREPSVRTMPTGSEPIAARAGLSGGV